MSLTIPKYLTSPEYTDYEPLFKFGKSRYGDDVEISTHDLTDDMLEAIGKSAAQGGEKSLARVVEAILLSRKGDFTKSVPKFDAAPEMFLSYFRHHLIDGWVYQRGGDGHLYPYLVTGVSIHRSRDVGIPDTMAIRMVANPTVRSSDRIRSSGPDNQLSTKTISLDPNEVTRKKIPDILLNAGYLVETEALRAQYEIEMDYHVEVLKGFAEQFVYTGLPIARNYKDDTSPRSRVKVIHDLHRSQVAPHVSTAVSQVFKDDEVSDNGMGPVPTHFQIPVFDLSTHTFLSVHTSDLTPYVYDKTLREKIVLPEDQRNLLDILTSDIGEFTGDVIEGKSTGNVILGKGVPGVGKTLTAEVYSEIIERPLYSIHSGNLGVTADTVRENLEVTFKRAKRWNAVLLLDEADVFVLERGENITQNAIVAEFLRTLEYFDGLMFMTTNRANNIDDAILSRAAAIIDYALPDIDGIREVWRVQARQQGVEIDPDLLEQIVHGFEKISPRDVKMLLRLALRVSKGNGVPLSTEVFARCAMFRGLHFKEGVRAE